jgi:hypothetical protein
MTHDYCATSDVLASMPDSGLNSSTDTGYTSALEMMITAASRLIDLEVGRWPGSFYPATTDETRYYDGSTCGDVQDIEDCVSITSVAVAETGGTAAADYTAWTERGVKFRELPRTEPYGVVAVFEDLYGAPWDLIQPA